MIPNKGVLHATNDLYKDLARNLAIAVRLTPLLEVHLHSLHSLRISRGREGVGGRCAEAEGAEKGGALRTRSLSSLGPPVPEAADSQGIAVAGKSAEAGDAQSHATQVPAFAACGIGAQQFVSGSLAGMTSVAATYPLDLVRTRMAGRLATQSTVR